MFILLGILFGIGIVGLVFSLCFEFKNEDYRIPSFICFSILIISSVVLNEYHYKDRLY